MKIILQLKITAIILCMPLFFCAYQRKNTFKRELGDVKIFVDYPKYTHCSDLIYRSRSMGGLVNVFYKADRQHFCRGKGSSDTSEKSIEQIKRSIQEDCPDCKIIAVVKGVSAKSEGKKEFELGGLYWDSRPEEVASEQSWFKAMGYCKSKGKRLPSIDEFTNNGKELFTELSIDDDEAIKSRYELNNAMILDRDELSNEQTEFLRKEKPSHLYGLKNPHHVFWTSTENKNNKEEAWIVDLWGFDDDDSKFYDEDRKNDFKSKLIRQKKTDLADYNLKPYGKFVICVSENEGGKK